MPGVRIDRSGLGRSRRDRRRHLRDAHGARGSRADHRLGRRRERRDRFGPDARDPGERLRWLGHARAPRRRRRGGALFVRPKDRGRVLLSLPGARADGNDERGRRRAGRAVRDLGRLAGAEPRAGRRGEAPRHSRVGRDRARAPPGGRLRPSREDRLRPRRRRVLEGRGRSGPRRLDALRRHAQRRLPSDLAPSPLGGARRVRAARGLAASRLGGRLLEDDDPRSRGGPSRAPGRLRHAVCDRRGGGRADRIGLARAHELLARRPAQSQRLRLRVLLRRSSRARPARILSRTGSISSGGKRSFRAGGRARRSTGHGSPPRWRSRPRRPGGRTR